jgi:hypothetical protein
MKAEEVKEPSGHTTSSWLNKDVIQTVWHGRIDAPTMVNLLEDLRRMIGTQRPVFWYSNTAGVTNYAVDIRKPSIDLLNFLKQQGCEEIVGIVDSPAIRMLSMSLSFVVGLRVKVFPNAEEAKRYLDAQVKAGAN